MDSQLADVDISLNPNPFNVWTSEYEYIKKLESEYIFLYIEGIRESIYGLESEYISVFAIESEYNYPWRDMDHSPSEHDRQNLENVRAS